MYERYSNARARRSPQKLIVRFSDGEKLFENSAAETLTKAIVKIGVARVESLGIKRLNHQLVSHEPPVKYQSNFAEGYHIFTHFSTDDKRRFLLLIGEKLGVLLPAELVD